MRCGRQLRKRNRWIRHHIASFTTVGDNEPSSLHSITWDISTASNAGYQLLLIMQHTTHMQVRASSQNKGAKKRSQLRESHLYPDL